MDPAVSYFTVTSASPEELVLFLLRHHSISIHTLAVHIDMNESTLTKKLNHSRKYSRPTAKNKPKNAYLEDYELKAIAAYFESCHNDNILFAWIATKQSYPNTAIRICFVTP